ncbi:MAG: hypothetical protein JOZ81_20355 [Chloroflexi bacterium]|nr:hypothetical protein [Chloroflexota bacterium]
MTSAAETETSATPDPQALLTVLTTEHFTLQGARGSTISESSARAALYVGGVSSGLVALGFFGQSGQRTDAFTVFALIVLPTLYILGVFTFARLIASSIEDLLYGRAINRIRNYYRRVAGDDSRYLMLGGHDDPLGVLANMGIDRPSRWQLLFTLGTMIACVNAIVGGSCVAMVATAFGASLAVSVSIGAIASIVSLVVHYRWQRHTHDIARAGHEVLFPSPPTEWSARGSLFLASGEDLLTALWRSRNAGTRQESGTREWMNRRQYRAPTRPAMRVGPWQRCRAGDASGTPR